MKSLTIQGLDNRIDRLIREKAEQEGLSLNKMIKKILEESLGFLPKKTDNRTNDFLDLFGTWSEEDVREFEECLDWSPHDGNRFSSCYL